MCTHSQTHSQTHTLALGCTRMHQYSHKLSHSCTHQHSHSHTLALTFTHTLTHTHCTRTHWHMHTATNTRTHRSLTAVVIVVSREELEAQREGREALDLLGESNRAKGRVRRAALPSLYGSFRFTAALKLLPGYQIERQCLRKAFLGSAGWVVRAHDVQVVVQIYLD